MNTFIRSSASLLFAIASSVVFAQLNEFATPETAIANLFPNNNPWVWTSTEGDLNGDGIIDLAMIITLNHENGPLDKRLLVLAGAADGKKYTLMSVSGEYCDAQKFFNLEPKGTSLFVTEVHSVGEDGSTTNTLQFRFNKTYGDFELIGKENLSDGKEYYRMSVNYLAGKYITYERVRGRIKIKEQKSFAVPSLARLNGFNCDLNLNGVPY